LTEDAKVPGQFHRGFKSLLKGCKE
jgi:hypothetical protein